MWVGDIQSTFSIFTREPEIPGFLLYSVILWSLMLSTWILKQVLASNPELYITETFEKITSAKASLVFTC